MTTGQMKRMALAGTALMALAGAASAQMKEADFWGALQGNIREGCATQSGQADALRVLRKDALEKACDCTASETVARLKKSPAMQRALKARDVPGMRSAMADAIKMDDGKPVAAWCSEKVLQEAGGKGGAEVIRPANEFSAKKGLTGASRENFVKANAAMCDKEVRSALGSDGANDALVKSTCACIGNGMADALSERELMAMIQSRQLTADIRQARERVFDGCLEKAGR